MIHKVYYDFCVCEVVSIGLYKNPLPFGVYITQFKVEQVSNYFSNTLYLYT